MPPQTRGVSCKQCDVKISKHDDYLLCKGVCNASFHIKCVNISLESFLKMNVGNEMENWKCNSCQLVVNNNMSNTEHEIITEIIEGKQSSQATKLSIEEKLDIILNKQLEMSAKIDVLTGKLERALQTIEVKNKEIISLNNDISVLKQVKPLIPKQYSKAVQQAKTSKQTNSPKIKINPQKLAPQNTTANERDGQLGNCDATNTIDNVLTPENSVFSSVNHEMTATIQTPLQDKLTVELSGQDDDAEFKLVTYKKQKKFIVRGTGTANNKLNCIESKIWVFLGRCARSSSVDDVRLHLEEKFPDQAFDIMDLNSQGVFRSFRIGASADLQEQIYEPGVWPKGALVTRYFFRRAGNQSKPGAEFGKFDSRSKM